MKFLVDKLPYSNVFREECPFYDNCPDAWSEERCPINWEEDKANVHECYWLKENKE